MIVMQMLLPRFLVLEVLLFLHIMGKGQGCKRFGSDLLSTFSSKSEDTQQEDRVGKQLPDAAQDASSEPKCAVELAESIKYFPLFYSATNQEFIFPTIESRNGSKIALDDHGIVKVFCPKTNLKVIGHTEGFLVCNGDSTYGLTPPGTNKRTKEINNLSDLTCTKSIKETITVHKSNKCGPDDKGRDVVIGWKLGSTSNIVTQIKVCHNIEEEETYYSRHVIRGASVDARQIDPGRPNFKEGSRSLFKASQAGEAYKTKSQKKRFSAIEGAFKGELYMARGHLAPDADFAYQEMQDATYYYANAAPQWQAFNNGNWKAVENAVREYGSKAGRDLNVITGTLGILKSPSDNQQMFLSDPEKIPVPEFYWKIVHDLDKAVVFVGLNNPFFAGNPEVEASICPDVCDEALWFLAFRKRVEKGYLYCCSYSDFKAVVPWAPDLGKTENPELLKNFLPDFPGQ